MKVKDLLNTMTNFSKKNAPAILTGMAVVGLVSTVVAAYKAAPRAKEILDKAKEDLNKIEPEKKEEKRKVVGEAVKEIVPVVAPTVISGVTTAACIVGSNNVSSKRIKLLSAGYSLAQSSLKDLNEKMRETLGDKKVQQVKEAVAKDKIKGEKTPDEKTVLVTGDGDVLCKDLQSGRYFRSNADKVRQAILELSSDCQQDMYVSLNDFYALLHIPAIPLGNDLGWNVDDLIKGQLPITLTAVLNDENVPCLGLDYDVTLRADFRNLY